MTSIPIDASITSVLFFAAFIVPGAISLRVYRLLKAAKRASIKEEALEAFTFSIVNFVLIAPIFYSQFRLGENFGWAYFIIIVGLFVTPTLWPIVLIKLIGFLSDRGVILIQAPTAWDHFFRSLKTGCWVIVELQDGRMVGGKFGTKSYASSYPEPGQLFLEEAWDVCENGEFKDLLPGGPGIILQPGEYRYMRVFGGLEDGAE